MKSSQKSSAAFTLVEMLVVIAIISLVALAMSRAVRGARRQANATKCMANMKNLHTAAMAYVADKGGYPIASSYETQTTWFSEGGTKNIAYHEEWGWVSWLPKNGPRRNDDGKTEWQRDSEHSHASGFQYFSNHDERTIESIREGALFKYTGKDISSYRCPDHVKTAKGETVHLGYAMNGWFYSHSNRKYHGLRKTAGEVSKVNSSQMALFVEIDEEGPNTSDERGGQEGERSGGHSQKRIFADDSVWEWTEDGNVELGSFNHRKAGELYTHVVFVDGHVASISKSEGDSNYFKSLGNGKR